MHANGLTTILQISIGDSYRQLLLINKALTTAGTDYLYTVKTEDLTIRLSTTLSFPLEKVMYLKLCKTNLGMIIVDRYYDSMP